MRLIQSQHLGEGWRVGHFLVCLQGGIQYATVNFLEPLLDRGYLLPMKDGLGRSLSNISTLMKRELPGFGFLETIHPVTFNKLKLLEFREFNLHQKAKMLLFVTYLRTLESSTTINNINRVHNKWKQEEKNIPLAHTRFSWGGKKTQLGGKLPVGHTAYSFSGGAIIKQEKYDDSWKLPLDVIRLVGEFLFQGNPNCL